MGDADDDDEDEFGGLYENGHWSWDEIHNGLLFISDVVQQEVEAVILPTKTPTGAIEFRDNVDLLEQLRFRRRYQRKSRGSSDVVTVQDLKDVALFTAPIMILSVPLINILHTTTMERFIRTLLFYTQYYLQTTNLMTRRMEELKTKIRQPICTKIENTIRDNLADMRILIAKEYITLLTGSDDLAKFHHMGGDKKRRSLTDMDAKLHEMLIRMCVQMIWIGLNRTAFNQIELEINRLFRSDVFNMVEHNLKTGYLAMLTAEEKNVLFGKCDKPEKKLKLRSPLLKEEFCHDVDFRLTALGILGFEKRNARLNYMEAAIAAPEEFLNNLMVPLGIVGIDRSKFDSMLVEIKIPLKDSESKLSKSSMKASSLVSHKSSTGIKNLSKKSTGEMNKVFSDIILPDRDTEDYVPSCFPELPPTYGPRTCSEVQRLRWVRRFRKLTTGRGGNRSDN